MSKIDSEILKTVVAAFTDGGVIKKNPSVIGGTWAFVLVNANNENVYEESGVVPATATRSITNNQTEQIAIVKALEILPENWTGALFTDSKIARGRVFLGYKTENLPTNIITRTLAARNRLGKISTVIFEGHPTKNCLQSKDEPRVAEIIQNIKEYRDHANFIDGIGKRRGRPVSRHNVRCDELCGEAGEKYIESLGEELSAMTNCPRCGALIKTQTLCTSCSDTHRTEATNLMAQARQNFHEKATVDYGEADVA